MGRKDASLRPSEMKINYLGVEDSGVNLVFRIDGERRELKEGDECALCGFPVDSYGHRVLWRIKGEGL